MKKKTFLIALLMFFIVPLFSPTISSLLAVEDAINLECPVAQAQLRQIINVPNGQTMTEEMIQNRIAKEGGTLTLVFWDISSLNGFEQFAKYPVTYLQINGCTQPLDFSSIAGLTDLETLWLGGLNITELSFTSNMTKLKMLCLPANNISNLSAIQNLKQLEELVLHNNRDLVSCDLTPISSLTNLKKLGISLISYDSIGAGPNEPRITLDFLSNLTQLETLIAHHANITDISALAGLNSLKNVDLRGNYITDITALSGRNLTSLNLHENYINLFTGQNKDAIDSISASTKIYTPQFCLKPEKSSLLMDQGETYHYQRVNQYETNDGIDFTFRQNFYLSEVEITQLNNLIEITGNDIKAVTPGSGTVTVALKGTTGEYATTDFEININGLLGIEPNQATIQIGDKQSFIAKYYNGYSKQETDWTVVCDWTTGSYNIASTYGKGTYKGIGLGSTTVTASYKASEVTANLTVEGELASLTLTPANMSIRQGETQQYKATAVFTNGYTTDVSKQAVWSVDDANIATINSDGLATGKADGQTKIIASYQGQTAEATLNVLGVDHVIINPTESTISVGEWQSYSLTAVYPDGSEEVIQPWSTDIIWETSDPTVASINSGNAEGLSEGVTTIKATYQGKTAEAILNVFIPDGLNITPKNKTLKIGETQEYKAFLVQDGNYKKDVTQFTDFTISDTTIANFRAWPEFNIIDALTAGTADIQGSYSFWDGSQMIAFTDTAIIIVKDGASDPSNPDDDSDVNPEDPSNPDDDSGNPGDNDPVIPDPKPQKPVTPTPIKPDPEPEKPVIEKPSTNPEDLENKFIARLENSKTITDAIAVVELKDQNVIPIDADEIANLDINKELRAYYWNEDKQKWVALTSYFDSDAVEVEFMENITEGYVAVFAVEQPVFKDLETKTDVEQKVNRLNGLGLIEGCPGSSNTRNYEPDRHITGVEFTTIQARILGMVNPGQQRMYEILPLYQHDACWYMPYLRQLSPLLPVTTDQIVTRDHAIASMYQLRQIIEDNTDDVFTGDLYLPQNKILTRADTSKLILSFVEGFGW